MEVGELISLYRKQAEMTIDELAAVSGVPKGTLNKIIGGTTKAPTLDNMKSIARALGKTLCDFDETAPKSKNAPPYSSEALKLAEDYDKKLDDWGRKAVRGLTDAEIERCEADRQADRAAALRENREQMEAGELMETDKVIRFRVPEYTMPMSAGTGQEAGQEFPQDLELIAPPPRGTSYIARVSGDSMEPTYHNGDMVFVHACEEIPVGRIGVFLMDGKQWIKERGDGVLISHNSEYDPIPMRDDIRCQGLVLGVCDESYFE